MSLPTMPTSSGSEPINSPSSPSFSIDLRHKNINSSPGVSLSETQRLVVGSVLDLYAGHPTLAHLSLWSKDATFVDPLTISRGYDRYAAQWYGLPAIFWPIQIQSHEVTSAGNPIQMKLRNKYTVKGIGKDQEISSLVRIELGDDDKITRVEDRWDGTLPEGKAAANRESPGEVARPGPVKRLLTYGASWSYWIFCSVAWWTPFVVFRKLNAVTVPVFIKVPRTPEEDRKMAEERERKSQ